MSTKIDSAEYYFKTSKRCNLRCTYCSEQGHYKDQQLLTPPIMKMIFGKILAYHEARQIPGPVQFFFTGGEILTMGKAWFKSVLKLQAQIFGARGLETRTEIMSNLTLLDQEWIDLLKAHHVTIGCSIDLYAKTRPFKATRQDSTPTVIDKFILLARNKVASSAIMVITKQNVGRGKEIYRTMNKIGLPFHALPLDLDAMKYCPQLQTTPEEFAQFLIDMAEEHLKPGRHVAVACLDGYINLIQNGYPTDGICHLVGRNCLQPPPLFFENTGETYFCGCFCEPETLVGNIFRDSVATLFRRLASKKVFTDLTKRYQKMDKTCHDCAWRPICNGGCPSFAYQEGDMFARSRFYCRVNQLVFPYLKKKLGKLSCRK